jgi:L-amino acid N-acyltransferase YncA
MQIRDAGEADIEQITTIYNEILAHSTAIYNDLPATLEDRIAWWHARIRLGYPVVVAVNADRIAGFASFGDFRSWPGYRFTVEGTVHIHADARGQGVGNELLKTIVGRAQVLGKHTMIAGVDSKNVASLRFFERFGFERVAHLREVGFKFNQFLDLIFLQYWLSPPSD